MASASDTSAKRIEISAGGVTGSELEELVNADISAFDGYFVRELKNDPLTRAERAAIKTYLAWALLYKQ